MEMLIALTVVLSVAVAATGVFASKPRRKAKSDRKFRLAYGVLLFVMSLSLWDMFASGGQSSLDMLALDLMPSAVSLWILSSSMSETRAMKWGLRIMLALNLMAAFFHGGCALLELKPLAQQVKMWISFFFSLMVIALLLCGMIGNMKNVKFLMRNGTVWATVSQSVDVAYFCFIILGMVLIREELPALSVICLAGVICGIAFRIRSDLKFLIWQNQETAIVESMKLTSLTSASDSSHIDDVYKELYERIVTYFELKKPYLNSDLTINDLVKVLYSNKLYISKAISQFTGRNFCQFVNYYRIAHSMECFRKNPELKIHELATGNGFNSVVSYSMSFRLFMGETPSEWFRKEKSRLLKKGK